MITKRYMSNISHVILGAEIEPVLEMEKKFLMPRLSSLTLDRRFVANTGFFRELLGNLFAVVPKICVKSSQIGFSRAELPS